MDDFVSHDFWAFSLENEAAFHAEKHLGGLTALWPVLLALALRHSCFPSVFFLI